MLVAAQSPNVVLQTQTRRVPTQIETYQLPVAPAPVPPLPASFSINAPVPLPGPISVPAPVCLPAPTPLPTLAVQEAPPPPRPAVEVPVHERLLAAQIAHFASQHHTSEYNRLKTDRQKGPLIPYVPFSLQAPAQVRELRERQAQNSQQQSWWISERNGCDSAEKVPCLVTEEQHNMSVGQTLPAMVTGPILDISQEITAAITSEMTTTHITKTSQSHPINISMVIPSDALPAVASRLVSPDSASVILFRLPDNYHLDRLTAPFPRGCMACSPFYRPGNSPCSSAARRPVPLTWAQQGNTELQDALDGELSLPPRRLYVPSQDCHKVRQATEFPTPPALPLPAPAPPSPPRGVVRGRHRHGRATSAPPVFRTLKSSQRRGPTLKDPRQCFTRNRSSPEIPTRRLEPLPSIPPPTSAITETALLEEEGQEDDVANGSPATGIMLPPPSVLPCAPPNIVSPPNDVTSENPTGVPRLGNLYLSSCPGKKVRLTGPVKGRGAICRDLRSDLSRMKELGASCVICCLGDGELDYLGASWNEYASVANELGLDVLRIPMPEGLTPLSPASFDVELRRIIESYTLRGRHILAHCRGGVGRAGLVACCWMLKLGLLGWKDPEVCARSCTRHSQCRNPSMTWSSIDTLPGQAQLYPRGQPVPNTSPLANRDQIPNGTASPPANVPRVCRSTLQLVERALTVIRRRRSLKAVETYEQVRFLVEYIEHLDAEARRGWVNHDN